MGLRRYERVGALVWMVCAAALGSAAFAQEHEPVFAPDGIAIRGYDPVAYFTEGEAIEGDSEFSYEWNGATWHFANQEHLDMFREAPDAYAPEYGGWCAWAVAQGEAAEVDPEQWTIHDGRLFLNFSSFVGFRFGLRLESNIESADENWPVVRSEIENR